MTNLFIFDFDGVLVHSLDEVALTSFNALNGTLKTSLDVLPPGYLEIFRRNRFHVQPAADFIPFARWCLEEGPRDPKQILSDAAFDALVRADTSSAAERRENFYETRRRFFDEQRDAWFAVHEVYEPLWSYLKTTAHEFVILTHKNLNATLALCEHFGLPMTTERVFSGDGGGAKHERIHELLSRYPADSYFYIDDSLRNLREVAAAKPAKPITFALAAWGYNGPEDLSQAGKLGYEVFKSSEALLKCTAFQTSSR